MEYIILETAGEIFLVGPTVNNVLTVKCINGTPTLEKVPFLASAMTFAAVR